MGVWIDEQTGVAGIKEAAWEEMQQLHYFKAFPVWLTQLQLDAGTLRSL